MRRAAIPLLLIPGLGLAFALGGCPGMNQSDCIDLGTCDCTFDEAGSCHLDEGGGGEGSPGDATGDGNMNIVEGGTIDAPPGCVLTQDPKDSPACVADSVGMFVDGAGGSDSNVGTRAMPFKTIAKAVASAGPLPRVYVCAGNYAENVSLDATHGPSLFGGFDCGSWKYSGTKPVVNPSTKPALSLKGVGGATVEDMRFEGSADQAVSGDSAIAAFVASASVKFARVELVAGAGAMGAPGTMGSNWTGTATAGTPAANGGNSVVCNCLDGTSSTGGKGGAIAAGGDPGTSNPAVGVLNGGGGGNMCTNGGTGANGVANGGGAGATKAGVLSATGWANTSDSAKGKAGNPGQGGGGGGGRTGVAGGGGGGCGGCGGAGGAAAGNGGSSFALLAFSSSVSAVGGLFQSGAAGSGGLGGPAQDGETGGATGPGACDGAMGGYGAGGSGGGGGAGGISAAIGYSGSAPSVSGTTLTPSTKGDPGGAGSPGAGGGTAGNGGNPGTDGKSGTQVAL